MKPVIHQPRPAKRKNQGSAAALAPPAKRKQQAVPPPQAQQQRRSRKQGSGPGARRAVLLLLLMRKRGERKGDARVMQGCWKGCLGGVGSCKALRPWERNPGVIIAGVPPPLLLL